MAPAHSLVQATHSQIHLNKLQNDFHLSQQVPWPVISLEERLLAKVSRMPDAPLSDEEFKAWRVCWRVNSAFSTKAAQTVYGRVTWCVKCGTEIAPNTLEYQSSFVSRVAKSSCRHSRVGTLCTECDTDIVFKISCREEKCFVESCDQVLYVDTSQASSYLSGLPKLTAE
jgi:hypothetical protein